MNFIKEKQMIDEANKLYEKASENIQEKLKPYFDNIEFLKSIVTQVPGMQQASVKDRIRCLKTIRTIPINFSPEKTYN